MNILEVCENPTILSVLRIVNIVLTIIRIAVPIILILSLMINYMKAVKDRDDDLLRKAQKSAVPKVIAAILVFMIPTFVHTLVEIADPGNRTYFSCLNDATDENINAAYSLMCEHYIDLAKESLKQTDYQIALNALTKVKNEADRAELQKELDELKGYVELRERIYEVANNYSREAAKKLRADIEAIKDETVRTRLLDLYKDALGAKGSLAQYTIDPNADMYRNLKNFDGKTLKSVLEQNGSSVEHLEEQIRMAVEEVGIGTREAPIAAAMTLIEQLANLGYRINYDWGGKWYHIGVDGNFGKKITPLYCDTHPNPDRCKTRLIWKGFDCSGFVSWALIQGFNDASYRKKLKDSAIPLAGKTTAVCDVGDILESSTHITIIAGIDEAKKSYIIAESSGGGVKLSYYNFNNAEYYCEHVQYSN